MMNGIEKSCNRILFSILCACMLPLPVMAVDLEFKGELLDRPCQIAPDSQDQLVTFIERPAKDFQYPPARSPVEPFAIRLTNCDTASWSTVKVQFTGVTEAGMGAQADYFLAMSTGPNQGKLAVGLLDSDGITPLKIGETENNIRATPIDGMNVELRFNAFVQATPGAIAAQSVVPGEYTSAANFELFYQ